MSDEENKSTSLAIITKGIVEQKREELRQAFLSGRMADPFTASIEGSVLLAHVLGAVGVALVSAAATYAIGRLTAPQGQTQQVGLMKGTVQIQNSTQGAFIPEIYGGPPSVSLVAGSGASWSSAVNVSTGANGQITKNAGTNYIYNAAAVHSASVAAASDAFISFTPSLGNQTAVAVGFSTTATPASGSQLVNLEFGVLLLNLQSGVDQASAPLYSRTFRVVNQTLGTDDLGNWQAGDTFRVEKRAGQYHLYHGLAEVGGFTPPTPSATVYLAVVIWSTGSGLTTAYVQIGGDVGARPSAGSGGCKCPAIVKWAKAPVKHSQIITTPGGGGGGKGHGGGGSKVEQIYYTIDIGMVFCRGPADLIREYANTDILLNFDNQLAGPTGVFDPNLGTTGIYDVDLPPPPNIRDASAYARNRAALLDDPGDPGVGGGSGTVQQGGSGIAVYTGTMTQLQDPTEQADIDAKHGANSTSADRGHTKIVHVGLNMTRWQGLVPNFTSVWQHKTLKTLGPIFASLCARIVDQDEAPLLTAGVDYDFTSLDSVQVRGMIIDGRRFTPTEIIDNTEVQDVYNYFTTEGEGKILAYVNGTEPTVTIPWKDFGWLDAGTEMPAIFDPLMVTVIEETKLPRQIDLKFINPGNDWDSDTQSSMRKVTVGNTLEALQVALSLNPDEAKTATDRRLLRVYIEGSTYKFTLSWAYLYVYAGYKIITTSPLGITYTMRLTAVNGGVGIRDCEAMALEISAFNQASVGSITPIYNPTQPVPSITILTALDIPDWTGSVGLPFGMFFGGAPRNTSTQSWSGFTLFIKRGTEWEILKTFTAAAVMGRVVSATSLGTNPNVTDNVGTIVVDLYGSKAILSGTSEANMIAGVNRAAVGDMIVGYSTAVRVNDGDPTHDNRWQLSVLRNGQFNTQGFIADNQVGRNFTVLNDAVEFVELDIGSDLNTPLHVKAVSLGQSLTDAADLTVICSGQTLRAAPVTNLTAVKDGSNDWLIRFIGSDDNASDYSVEVWSSTDRTNTANRKRTLPVVVGTSHAVTLVGTTYGDLGVLKNNLNCSAGAEESAVSTEDVTKTYTRFDFNMRWVGADNTISIPISITTFMTDAYQGALNRNATGGEDTTWRTALTTAYNTSPAALLAEAKNRLNLLFTSAEYTTLVPNTSPYYGQFVEDLYESYLGRPSDPNGKAYWVNELTNNGNTRAGLINAFQLSLEFSIVRASIIEPPDQLARYIVAGIQTRSNTTAVSGGYGPDLTQCPISIEWRQGYMKGTVNEVIKSFGVVVFNGYSAGGDFRNNVDPGFSPTKTNRAIEGRTGRRYTIFLSGTEYRVYANFGSSIGQKPLVRIPAPGTGFPYPLRFTAKVRDVTTGAMAIENITAGGDQMPTTIYSEAEQIKDFAAVQNTIYLRVYERSPIASINGFPVDLVAP